MALVSGDIVAAEESEEEEWLLSQAHPVREASTKAVRQETIKVAGRREVLLIFINVRIPQKPTFSMG
jgi:hypothetical protein